MHQGKQILGICPNVFSVFPSQPSNTRVTQLQAKNGLVIVQKKTSGKKELFLIFQNAEQVVTVCKNFEKLNSQFNTGGVSLILNVDIGVISFFCRFI